MSWFTFNRAIILPKRVTLIILRQLNKVSYFVRLPVNTNAMVSNGTVENKSRTNWPLKYSIAERLGL